MGYAFLTLSVFFYAIGFVFNDRYSKTGSGLVKAFYFIAFANSAGAVLMLILNRFQPEWTPFTALFAFLTAANGIFSLVFSVKALARIDLSLFSLFSMLGGMILPFLAGWLFFDEAMTWQKGVCVALIVASLSVTVRRGEKKGGWLYLAGIFIFYGTSGILNKIFMSAPYEKTGALSYSFWVALIEAHLAGALILLFWKKRVPIRPKEMFFAGAYGAFNRAGNFLAVWTLSLLPASAQFPFITGGTIIVSTLFSYVLKQRPGLRQWIAVGLAFLGTLILLIP